MTFLEKAFGNRRLVFAALVASLIAVFVAFMTAPHDDDPDWVQTMMIVASTVLAVFAFGMAEAEFARIARAALGHKAEPEAKARSLEVLASAERNVQRLPKQGWTRSDFSRALAETIGEEREPAKEAP